MKQFTRIEPTDVVEVGDKFRREVVVKRYESEDGNQHEFTTYGAENFHEVSVLAVTETGDIVLVYQFRPGQDKWLYDMPGGGIEQNEQPEAAAKRELLEETGSDIEQLEYVGECGHNGLMNATNHVFMARGCKPQASKRQLEVEEDKQGAEVRILSRQELLAAMSRGEVCHGSPFLLVLDTLYTMNIKEKI